MLRNIEHLIKEQTFRLLSQSQPVTLSNPEGNLLFANEFFCQICGFDASELISNDTSEDVQQVFPKLSFQQMWLAVQTVNHWKGELKGQSKSGKDFWTEINSVPILGPEGNIQACLAVHRDITSEKLTKLSAEEEKLRIQAIYNNAAESNILISPEGNILFFNRSAHKLFKRLRGIDLVEGNPMTRYVAEINEDHFAKHFEIALAGEEVKSEQQLTLRGNLKRWYRLTYSPVYDDQENLLGVSRSSVDIDKEKKAEEDRLREKKRLRAMIETIPDAIFFKDGNGRWLITNQVAKELFKLDEIDWIGKTDEELIELHPEFKHVHQQCLIDDEKAWQARQLSVFTEYVQDENGVVHEHEVRKLPVFGADGSRKSLVIIGSDVSDRRRNENDLKNTKKMLEQSMRLAGIGAWEADFENHTLTWSKLTREIAEVPENYIPQLDTVIQFYREGESRDKIMEAIERARKTGAGFELEVEMVSAKGKIYHTRTIGEPVMQDGRCIKIYGYFQDLTEKVELNRKNKQIENKFSRLIEKSADAIVLQDVNGNIQYFSPAAERMLGYSQSEVIGKNMALYFHPDDVAEAMERRRIIRPAHGEAFPIVANRIRHKNGYYVYLEGTVTNLLQDETVQAMVVNFRDVTEKKATEEKLRTKSERMEQIAYLFSHEVRGPVATIMGLNNIFNRLQPQDHINGEVLEKIQVPMHKLDDIISRIVHLTNELEMGLPTFPVQADSENSAGEAAV